MTKVIVGCLVGLKSLDVSPCNELLLLPMIIKNSLALEYFFTHKSTFGVHYRTGSPGQLGLRVRYDTRCHFNVRSKADISQLNLPHGSLDSRVTGSQNVTQFHLWSLLLRTVISEYNRTVRRDMSVEILPTAAQTLIHTATPDTTKLSCLCRVCFGGVNWIPDNSRLSLTENLKSELVQSIRNAMQCNCSIHTRQDRLVVSCQIS